MQFARTCAKHMHVYDKHKSRHLNEFGSWHNRDLWFWLVVALLNYTFIPGHRTGLFFQILINLKKLHRHQVSLKRCVCQIYGENLINSVKKSKLYG